MCYLPAWLCVYLSVQKVQVVLFRCLVFWGFFSFFRLSNIGFLVEKFRQFAILALTQVSIIAAVLNVSPGSGCHEHRASVALSNLQQWQQRQHTLMGSRLTVLCRVHEEAIIADFSGMQISFKWLTIFHSLDPPPPPTPPALYLYLSNPLYLCLFMPPARVFRVSLSQSLQCVHSFFPSLSPGMHREGFGLLCGGSEGSFLL